MLRIILPSAWALALAVSCIAAVPGPAAGDELLKGEPRLASFEAGFASYSRRLDELEAELASFRAAHDSEPTCDSCVHECNCCCPGWFASADYLNWHVQRDDLGFAIRDPAGLGVPSGGQPILSLDLGPESGYRVALGRRTAAGWEVALTYTYLRADDIRTFAPGAGQVLAIQSSPSTGLTNADSVTAVSEFDYDVFDLSAGHWFGVNDALSLMVLGGVRIASIDHLLQADYSGGAFVNGAIDVPTDIDAYGGRVGGALHWHMNDAISLFSSSSLSVMASDVEASRREVNAGAVVIEAHQGSDPVLTAADVALGVNYSRGNWTLGTGYEFVSWFGAVRPLEFSDSFNGGTLARSATDLGLHGIFVNAAYVY